MRPMMVLGAGMLALGLGACARQPADDQPAEQAQTPAPARRAEIAALREGDTIPGPAVGVRLAAFGFAVVPAGDTTPNSGHFHLFLDREISAPGVPIPAEPGFIIHLGTGADNLELEAVAPGEHRLISVVGDAVHVPVEPLLVDTVRFFVR